MNCYYSYRSMPWEIDGLDKTIELPNGDTIIGVESGNNSCKGCYFNEMDIYCSSGDYRKIPRCGINPERPIIFIKKRN